MIMYRGPELYYNSRMKRWKYVTVDKQPDGGSRLYFRRGHGPRTPLPDDMASQEFKEAYWAAFRGQPIPHVRDMPRTSAQKRKQRTERVLSGCLRSARTRSRNKSLPFDIEIADLLALADAQDFRCAITGIEFFAKAPKSGRVDPYTPSIDRIEPSPGYTKGNIRIVIFAVNAMLLDWGETVFVQVANSYRYWQRRTKRGGQCPAPEQSDAPHL